MKIKNTITILLFATVGVCYAQDIISIEREQLGSGTPAVEHTTGLENAVVVNDNMYHVPQYMPGFPTSATLWPRVITVPCVVENDKLICQGYHWQPSLGRGEYLFVEPKIVKPVAPVVVTKEVKEVVVKEVPVTVYKEVPVKKGKE